jgi:hypothetical protein
MREAAAVAPSGACVGWGIPFDASTVVIAGDTPVEVSWEGMAAPWLVLMHVTDVAELPRNTQGLYDAPGGPTRLHEHVADYVFRFADGVEERARILRQHQIGMYTRGWGTTCFEAVAHRKPAPARTNSEQPGWEWGVSQTRVVQPNLGPWVNWLWAWKNPRPDVSVVGLRMEPAHGPVVLFAVSAVHVGDNPLRWGARRKAVLSLSAGESFDPNLDAAGLSKHIQLDLGQVISVQRRAVYPDAAWSRTSPGQSPELSPGELLVEYTAHEDACFHLPRGAVVPVAAVEEGAARGSVRLVPPATRRVVIKVTDKATGKPVAVKLHLHGEAGEYLAPVDRNRHPNPYWYEDWSVDYLSPESHACTYIDGETVVDLPLGRVYVEISKGFEIRPIRRVMRVGPQTRSLAFAIERVLPWRERGWVTADTHVHFLSPHSARLEGAGEGVNLVNLLASQWGELMTNVGDFDGRTTWGSRASGGDGEYLVRVGTENRQHVLGHISLLGYRGPMIAPLTVGGPDESALGDPVDVLLTEWARQCRRQGGVVIVPHFPFPRAEHAAAIVDGAVDGVEMTSWANLYGGIDPYSLSDWYRYLNNGYFVAAVGGTDKMTARTAVGTVRTYAKLPAGRPFGLESWKQAIRAGQTFATYGPLLEFRVEGRPPGAWLRLGKGGATLAVEWEVASVTLPMTRVELVVNGEIRESRQVDPTAQRGNWNVKVDRSSWLALLVRGARKGRTEMIAAHSSPVMAAVAGQPFFAAADALTILHQIEGALAYLDTVGTRAETAAYRRMRLLLTSSFRELHNRLHRAGHYHDHTAATNHAEHHR